MLGGLSHGMWIVVCWLLQSGGPDGAQQSAGRRHTCDTVTRSCTSAYFWHMIEFARRSGWE